MNFIEAAIEILRGAPGQALHVEELCRRALDRQLLAQPGKNPLRSMKGRLTSELKKGAASKVVKIGPDRWQLRTMAATPAGHAPAAQPDSARPPDRSSFDPGPASGDAGLAQVLAPRAAPPRAHSANSPNERRAEELYADELVATEPGAAFREYRDALTGDEDRARRPEIVAPRRERPGRIRSERRARREGERAARRSQQVGAREREPRAGAPPAARECAPAPARPRLPGNPLADAAALALDAVRAGQPVQVRQLAEMMRKRKLLPGDPKSMWPLLKAALLADEQSYRTRGFLPRIQYRGRDLFALRAGALAELEAAEAAYIAAANQLVAACHEALRSRLRELSAAALQQVAHVYLMRAGWRQMEWIKRAGDVSYAVAEPPGTTAAVLVSVCPGAEPVSRRGVGELRAGTAAKNLPSGMLLSPQDLSEAAVHELAKAGAPVAVLCGDAWVAALMDTEVGVFRVMTPIWHLDELFLAELAAE